MNWKRGLTRLYLVLWALFALSGLLVIANLWTEQGASSSDLWSGWAAICLGLPFVLLCVLKWVTSGFQAKRSTSGSKGENE